LLAAADKRMPKSTYTNPLPGVPNTLIELAKCGLPLCVLTSDIRKRAADMIRELDFEDAITCIITPEDVEKGKPAPDMIIHAAKKLNVTVSKIAMVGDSVLDIKMARAAGAFPVAVLNHCEQSSEIEGLSESTIRSITEIRV
ncbi:MAG: HAD family hydrolase, partial [Desulfobacteraceae bacterium]|nr:HAD family hydrolase [Desulfobacteraceae bacterium]